MEFVKWVSLADSVEINWCGRSRSKKILIPLNRRNDLKNRKLACTSIIGRSDLRYRLTELRKIARDAAESKTFL